MGISLERLHLTGKGVTLADVEAALARAPGPALSPGQGEIGGGDGGKSPAPARLDSPIDLSLAGGDSTVVPADALDPFARMNRTERRYAAEVLDPRKHAGAILWWGFERIKLKLADRCWLTVDFAVAHPNERLSLIDVKGRKGRSWYAKEDARIKLRVTAEQFFFLPILVTWPRKGGGWAEERIGPTRG